MHGQGLRVETRAIAHFAQHFHIRQKTHGHGTHALAFARRAAPCAGVKAKTRSAVATRFGFQGFGKEFAYRIPKTDIGSRARARCFAYGGLIDFQDPIDLLPAFNRRAMLPSCRAFAIDRSLHIGQQHIACQGGFART